MTLESSGTRDLITTLVVETLERGWSDCLPKHAYLTSKLSQMERRLALTPDKLTPVLLAAEGWRLEMMLSQRRISLGGVDVFTGGQVRGFLPSR